MTMVALGDVLVKHHAVRRRVVNGDIFLIKLTDLCRLDEFSNSAWKLINGKWSIFEIANHLGPRFPSMAQHEVIEKTVLCLSEYLNLGYVLSPSDALDNKSEVYKALTVSKYLGSVMQVFYSQPGIWQKSISESFKEKLTVRFFRILYEMYESEISDKPIESETEFRNRIAGKTIFNIDDTVSDLKNKYDIKGWRHDVDTHSIVIQYRGTVYSGDVDNRL
ncbi:MAG: hypothetical protein P8X74_09950 [Reinekea sp.]